VTFEIIFLALVSTVRPTSLAAVYAMLSSDRARRLLIVYNISGLIFTVGFGLLVVWAFNGIDIRSGSDQTEAIVEIAGGIVLLALGLAMLLGLIGGSRPEDAPKPGGRFEHLLEGGLSARTAIVAGPATHLPGLFYLIALNVIVGSQSGVIVGLIEVLIYNAIWFAIPVGALAVSIFAPDLARKKVGAINDWARRNARSLLIFGSFAVGLALLSRGLLGT
jgi:hypothetical protein